MAVKPQAVALVSSGSRGNKLLFYDSGISKPHSLESGYSFIYSIKMIMLCI